MATPSQRKNGDDDDARCSFPRETLDSERISAREFTDLERRVLRMETALLGDSEAGNAGAISRLRLIEDKLERHDRKFLILKIMWGVGAGILFFVGWLIERVIDLKGK